MPQALAPLLVAAGASAGVVTAVTTGIGAALINAAVGSAVSFQDISYRPSRRCNVDEQTLETIHFLGGSIIDQTSATAMVAAIWSAIGRMPEGSVKSRMLSDLSNLQRLTAIYETPADPCPPGTAAGTYVMAAVGDCMAPIVMDADRIEVAPALAVHPGHMAAIVTTYAFSTKFALYLGRYTGDMLRAMHPHRPDGVHLFFQREPLSILAVADADLIAMQRVVATHRGEERQDMPQWSFDVSRHPHLASILDETQRDGVSPADSRHLPVIAHESFRACFDRIGELAKSESWTAGGDDRHHADLR